jgi:ATP/maltotriose-dependent transcriptional regulator MalT
LLLAEAKLIDSEPDAAAELLDTATAEGGEMIEFFAPMIGRLRALVASEHGSIDEALDHIETALAQARSQGVLYEETLLLLAKAEVLRRAGREVDADEEREADRLIDELGIRREPAGVS